MHVRDARTALRRAALIAATALAFTFTLASSGAWAPTLARADAPPPAGKKRVGYGFVVENLAAFPDHVLLIYPWSLSNGAPTREYTQIEEGVRVGVGRRVSGTPKVHAMRRAAYEEWKQGYTPVADHFDEDDAALEALFAREDVVECSVSLNPRHTVSRLSSADKVEDRFRAERIDDERCTLSLVSSSPSGRCSIGQEAPPLSALAIAGLALLLRRRRDELPQG